MLKEHELQFVLKKIGEEYIKARGKHAPMRGAHEGYAVILEELEELWDEVKKDKVEAAKREAYQVAAMALAFIAEVP